MLRWLRRILAPNLAGLEDHIEETNAEIELLWQHIEKLEEDLELYQADMKDEIFPLLRKLNQRNAVRDTRAKTENINTKGSGIMRYGTP